ncbi:hypothetical protein SDC9_09190 [bioreactor metagenome]|uniref:Pyruvate kinase C-terminal domain-containing protein n=1 Tax=bioreactor metagenome TaxID=1076179 RepID=A0A644T9N0_9ZZZZ|nr:pyruvate kinase alpha/beta domain-containing protein [Negativicutes bacterium]
MYFQAVGKVNTGKTVELALQKAAEYGINDIVVASCGGDTAKLLVGKVENLVCVTHANGYAAPGESDMPDQVRHELAAQGVKLLTTTHVLSGAERGISRKFGGVYPVEIMAHTLRMFGQGVKVCVEIAVMALDAGLIPFGKDVIVIGGSAHGADTAVVMRPAHADHIFDNYIAEIICKPGHK